MIRRITNKNELVKELKKIKQHKTTFMLIGFRYLTFGTLIKEQIVSVHGCSHVNCTFNNEYGDKEIKVVLKQDKFYISDTGRVYYINFDNQEYIDDTIDKLERIERTVDGEKFLNKVYGSDMPIKRVDKDEEIGYRIRDFED